MAGTSDETVEIASEHLASRMRGRSHSWLCLLGAVLWLALWVLIEERIEQGAAWTSPLAGMGPLLGAALVSVFLVITVVPTLVGLSGVLGAVIYDAMIGKALLRADESARQLTNQQGVDPEYNIKH